MLFAFIFAALAFLGLFGITVTFHLRKKADDAKQPDERQKGWIYGALLLLLAVVLFLGYRLILGTPWEAHLFEWMNLVIRLMHFTFGIAWIGASFYFVFLENALNRTEGIREELAGNLWAVHGGGFYYLEKYKIAPAEIPKKLHWFKYEAYFTWLSGFCLLFVVYYFNAKSMLIDPQIMDLHPFTAITIGITSLLAGWLLYDGLCRTSLVQNSLFFGLVFLVVAIGFAFFYTHVFSPRAAFIHFGAFLGTIMAANVFFVIIPSQKALVAAAKKGEAPDPQLGKKAGLRSLHNNYFTLPVLFVMISNHFPTTFGHEHAWLILFALSVALAGIKHYLNVLERHAYNVWILPASILILLGIAFITGPKSIPNAAACRPIKYEEIHSIIQTRCQTCHASNPTDDIFKVAPNGVRFETPAQIIHAKDKILQRVVLTESMPLLNKTKMTQAEREAMKCWIEQGAKP